MQMPKDARTRGAAKIHSQIQAVGLIAGAQSRFHALRELHHLAERRSIAQIQFCNVRVGNNHHVPRGIGETFKMTKGFWPRWKDRLSRSMFARNGTAKIHSRRVSAGAPFMYW